MQFIKDIKSNWVDIESTANIKTKGENMSLHLLVIYEIADKASKVTNKKTYIEFEKWVRSVVQKYQDAAIERIANMHLFSLKEQFSS